jgi:D-glycero-D-manno-heptose 1,7-bisphosphate phosphatase
MEKKRILCLDLDGTVRRSKSGKTFIEGPDDIELIPGMKERIHYYKNLGYIVMGITNQGGVAHGFKPYGQMTKENGVTEQLLRISSDKNVFYAIYCCPYDEKGKVPEYSFRSLHRKPSIGMLCEIETEIMKYGEEFPDWDNSLFVGDRPEDEECAKAAGIPFMWAHDFLNSGEENYNTTQQSEGAGYHSGPDLSDTV